MFTFWKRRTGTEPPEKQAASQRGGRVAASDTIPQSGANSETSTRPRTNEGSGGQRVLETLRNTEVMGAHEAGRLQVFGLRWVVGNGHDYMTLDEALEQKLLDFTEISEAGSVPMLKLVNRAAKMVFLMAGEELVGGKQNRVLNSSIMVPAASEMPIPVTCVERGRWGYRSRHFSSGHTTSHSSLRLMMTRHVSSSYRTVGAPRSDQAAVWREVDRKMASMGTESSSDALHDVYLKRARELDALVGAFPLPEGSNGAAFAINGKPAGADLFDKAETLRKLWPKLARSYAADALEDAPVPGHSVTPGEVRDWVAAASAARQHWFKSPGLGNDVRLEGDHLLGATLLVDEQPVHLELFREDPPEAVAEPV